MLKLQSQKKQFLKQVLQKRTRPFPNGLPKPKVKFETLKPLEDIEEKYPTYTKVKIPNIPNKKYEPLLKQIRKHDPTKGNGPFYKFPRKMKLLS